MIKRWSTKRTVSRVRKALNKAFGQFSCEEHGYTVEGGSYYFSLPEGQSVRVSDHNMPAWGGYSIERGDRFGPADISLSPDEATFEQFTQWLQDLLSPPVETDLQILRRKISEAYSNNFGNLRRTFGFGSYDPKFRDMRIEDTIFPS